METVATRGRRERASTILPLDVMTPTGCCFHDEPFLWSTKFFPHLENTITILRYSQFFFAFSLFSAPPLPFLSLSLSLDHSSFCLLLLRYFTQRKLLCDEGKRRYLFQRTTRLENIPAARHSLPSIPSFGHPYKGSLSIPVKLLAFFFFL